MSDQQQQQSQEQPRGVQALQQHIKHNRVDTALWLFRVVTIIFNIAYIIPIFGNPTSAYYKVLIANAATSALRLHQRMPPFKFSREFLQKLLLEDSCHYMLYSLIFLYAYPVLLIILPVTLFAVLHSASYSLTLLDTLGQNSWWGARLLISLVEFQTRNILRLAAFAEIFVMPLAIVLVFIGKAGIMTPLVYYQFLVLRYSSRRNPYTRNVFYELRLATENFANGANTPQVIRKVLQSSISLVSRLAPPMQQQQQ